MRERRLLAIEATEQAQTEWVAHVASLVSGSIRSHPTCNSWYLGANIPGKKRVYMPYVGGQPAYRAEMRGDRGGRLRGFPLHLANRVTEPSSKGSSRRRLVSEVRIEPTCPGVYRCVKVRWVTPLGVLTASTSKRRSSSSSPSQSGSHPVQGLSAPSRRANGRSGLRPETHEPWTVLPRCGRPDPGPPPEQLPAPPPGWHR